MKTLNTGKPGKVQYLSSHDGKLYDVAYDTNTSQWFTLVHSDWQDECWVVWHPTGIRIVTNAGGPEPIRDFDEAKGWLGSITKNDGTVVAVEFHGTSTDRTRLFVKMLGAMENDEHVALPTLWSVPLSDLYTVYFW